MKQCPKCGLNKKIDEFYFLRNPKARAGGYYMRICKKCSYARGKKWRSENLERSRETESKSRKRLRVRRRLAWLAARIEFGKMCPTCGLNKKLDEYQIRKSARDGRSSECKICINKKKKIWVANNHEYVLQDSRRRNKKMVSNLGPCYVKRIIKKKYKIPFEDISKDMIDRERDIITINRMLKEKHKCQ